MRPAWAAAVLAMAVAACGTPGPNSTPRTAAPGDPTAPIPTPGLTDGASAPVAAAFGDWVRIDMPDPAPNVYGGGTPSGLVAFGGAGGPLYVAVGTVATDCCDAGDPASRRGVVWTSADGQSWDLHDPIEAFQHATVRGVLADGARLIAIGSVPAPVPNDGPDDPVPAVWTSTDATTWVRAPGAGPSFVAVGRERMFGAVSGGTRESPRTRFVHSADGLVWEPDSPDFDAEVRGIAASADGSAMAIGIVAGVDRPDGSPTTDVVVWRRADGTAWTSPQRVAHATFPIALTSDASGYLALLNKSVQLADGSIESVSQAWRFVEGADPVVASIPLGDEEGVEPVWGVGGSLFLVGYGIVNDVGRATVWVSSDGGGSWDLVPDQDSLHGIEIGATGIVETPAGLVAVGRRWDSPSAHPVPVAWISLR
jgi:hypothetical protein